MIDKIILFILLLILTINSLFIIKLKWYNDYFVKNFDECFKTNNKFLYEIETYRYKLFNFIYNNEYKDLIEQFKYSFDIILIVLYIILILFGYYLYQDKDINKIIITIILLIYVIIIKYIGENILNEYKKIEEKKNDTKNNLFKYYLVYKIFNIILYLNQNDNIMKEKFQIDKDEDLTFSELLDKNIGKVYSLTDELRINYIKKNAIENYDYLKFINFNIDSTLHNNDFFKRIYIIIDGEKYYIEKLNYTDNINNIIKQRLIKENIVSKDTLKLNFVDFFIENSKILFSIKNNNENIIKEYNKNIKNFIIIYLLLLLFILYVLLHLVYNIINSKIYIYTIIIISIILLATLWYNLK